MENQKSNVSENSQETTANYQPHVPPQGWSASFPFTNPRGIKGRCVCCGQKKNSLVNDVCIDCASPERNSKHQMR